MHTGVTHNQQGLNHYNRWEMDKAISSFSAAVREDVNKAEHHLNLARAYARDGRYQDAIHCLSEYIQIEPDSELVARYEPLFTTELDRVEEEVVAGMRTLDLPGDMIKKAIQMWLDFRISLGREPMPENRPEVWAAALTYSVLKVNFVKIERFRIARIFNVSERAIRDYFNEFVQILDILPADFRYFAGENNPLDELLEASQIMEALDLQFKSD
jgi:tetratricopeptide (TPR) repeat protein